MNIFNPYRDKIMGQNQYIESLESTLAMLESTLVLFENTEYPDIVEKLTKACNLIKCINEHYIIKV